LVIFAGRKGGYGNALDIRHPNGFVSRYGHLRGYASGIHAGSHVTIGQTVAFVGMTGLATGPHLHFEILVGGQQRDPRSALSQTGGPSVAAGDRSRFECERDRLVAALEHPGAERLALR
jgi:murein DD-endopeptidase MepM/ murein hydrolase activator NlpD